MIFIVIKLTIIHRQIANSIFIYEFFKITFFKNTNL